MNKESLLTVLNYSGGQQSSCILWMVIKGVIERPKNFLVMNADPGMENSNTYRYNVMMFEECRKASIPALTAPGPNLYKDLTELHKTKKTRIDNPPYWTKDFNSGKRGRLLQKCTREYKIAPMDRAVRSYLKANFGVENKLRPGLVKKWIGFSFDEVHRIKPSAQKYIDFEYPLVDLRMRKMDVIKWFEEQQLPIPPRSVCNACFANGANTFKKMAQERPEDFQQAKRVDEAVRDLSQIGVKDEVFVSHELLSLAQLEKDGFEREEVQRFLPGFGADGDADDWGCDSGYCFV